MPTPPTSYPSTVSTFAASSVPSAAVSLDFVADPLTEAGDAVWYVRPSSGGQFGPAAAHIMRGWLAEGRIAPDALVWREGWPDWREAAGLFPQLSAGPAIPELEAILSAPVTSAVRSYPKKRRTRRRRPQVTTFGIVILAILIIFLVILLFVLKT